MNILLIDGRMFIFLKKVVRDLMTKPIQSSSSIVLLYELSNQNPKICVSKLESSEQY